jgi:chromosome segregation ATPase
MHKVIVAMLCLMALSDGPAVLAADDTTARVREMLRRTQESLREAQADNATLTQARDQAEQKLQALTKQLGVEKNSARSANQSLQVQAQSAVTAAAESERQRLQSEQHVQTLAGKLQDVQQQLLAREAELTQAKDTLAQTHTSVSSCEAKNLQLYGYANEVLDRYQRKGVWAAVAQKEPIFKLHDVAMENVVQEYQLKFESQKARP